MHLKKTLIYSLATLFMGLGVVCLTACGDDEEEINEMAEAPYLDVSTIHLLVGGTLPYSGTFTIKTNQQWKITEKPSWVALDVTEGNGGLTVNVTITTSDKNYRTGNIVVASTNGQFSKTIEVRQNGNTLSVVTGDYKGSKVTKGQFLGPDKRVYAYEHKITVEFYANGSHLASEYGVTGHIIKGKLSDGLHSVDVTVYSDKASTSFTYRAFATKTSTGEKVYGREETIISHDDNMTNQ